MGEHDVVNPLGFETIDVELFVVDLDFVLIDVGTLVEDFLDFVLIDVEMFFDLDFVLVDVGILVDVVICDEYLDFETLGSVVIFDALEFVDFDFEDLLTFDDLEVVVISIVNLEVVEFDFEDLVMFDDLEFVEVCVVNLEVDGFELNMPIKEN